MYSEFSQFNLFTQLFLKPGLFVLYYLNICMFVYIYVFIKLILL